MLRVARQLLRKILFLLRKSEALMREPNGSVKSFFSQRLSTENPVRILSQRKPGFLQAVTKSL